MKISNIFKKKPEPQQIKVCIGAKVFHQQYIEFPFPILKPSPCTPGEAMNAILPALQKEYKFKINKINKDNPSLRENYFYYKIMDVGKYDLSELNYNEDLSRSLLTWRTVAVILWAFANTYNWNKVSIDEEGKYDPFNDPEVEFIYTSEIKHGSSEALD